MAACHIVHENCPVPTVTLPVATWKQHANVTYRSFSEKSANMCQIDRICSNVGLPSGATIEAWDVRPRLPVHSDYVAGGCDQGGSTLADGQQSDEETKMKKMR
jgi:hypothetical protein